MSEILLPLSERHDSRLNFRLVLLSVFLERIAFYGLKTILIFYATSSLKITEGEFLTYLIYSAFILTLARLIGGLISDFLTGPKMGMIIGLVLCLTGGIVLTLFENASILFPAIILLYIGSGFFKTSSYSLIGHLSFNKPILLEKRFILNYLVINVGSMLATISLGMIGENYGYFYAIVFVCLVYVFSLLAIYSVRATTKDFSQSDTVIDREVQPKSNVKFVILAIIGAAFFVFIFELYDTYQANRIYYENARIFGPRMPEPILYAIPAAMSFLLFIPYYFLATKLSVTFKIAMGCFLLAALWMIWIPICTSSQFRIGLFGLLILGSLEAIMSFFVTLTIPIFICRYSPKKIYGTLFGIEAVLSYLALMVVSFVLDLGQSMTTHLVLGIVLVGIAIYFLYLRKKFQPLDNFRLEKKEVV